MGSSLSLPSEFSQVPQEVEASEDQRKLLLCQRVLAVPAKRMGYRYVADATGIASPFPLFKP